MRIVLVAAVLLALAGCSSDSPTPDAATPAPATTPAPASTSTAGGDEQTPGVSLTPSPQVTDNDPLSDDAVADFCEDVTDYLEDVQEVLATPDPEDARELQADALEIAARYQVLRRTLGGDPESLARLQACHRQFVQSDGGP